MTGIDGANAACVKRWSGAPNESYIENFVSEDFGSENFLSDFPIPSLGCGPCRVRLSQCWSRTLRKRKVKSS